MAGPTVRAQYLSDDGNHYCVELPTWESAMQGTTAVACTTQAKLPRGYHRRKRLFRYDSNGQEQAVTVLLPTDTLWTTAIGTAKAMVQSPDFNTVPGTANATFQGAIGERRLDRG